MGKFTETTLANALRDTKLTELPKEWDKKTPFKDCIIKIETKAGDAYFLGKYNSSDKFKYKVTKSFGTAPYSRTSSDVIYPIGVTSDIANEVKIVTAPRDINFADVDEALAFLKEKKYKGWQLLKDPEKIKAAVEKVLIAESQTEVQPKEENDGEE